MELDNKYMVEMSPQMRTALAEDCEDYLLHRHIPLRSEYDGDIIEQALREGYKLSKFDRFYVGPLR